MVVVVVVVVVGGGGGGTSGTSGSVGQNYKKGLRCPFYHLPFTPPPPQSSPCALNHHSLTHSLYRLFASVSNTVAIKNANANIELIVDIGMVGD